jgi:hypothetical protein
MSKLTREFENQVDNVLIEIVDRVVPAFKDTGHTPNMITTYSVVFGLKAMCTSLQLHTLYHILWIAWMDTWQGNTE